MRNREIVTLRQSCASWVATELPCCIEQLGASKWCATPSPPSRKVRIRIANDAWWWHELATSYHLSLQNTTQTRPCVWNKVDVQSLFKWNADKPLSIGATEANAPSPSWPTKRWCVVFALLPCNTTYKMNRVLCTRALWWRCWISCSLDWNTWPLQRIPLLRSWEILSQ